MGDQMYHTLIDALEAMAGWGFGVGERDMTEELQEMSRRLQRFHQQIGRPVAQLSPYVTFAQRLQTMETQAQQVAVRA
jgi:hypothetical protein